jgi:CRP-like cAMP-binding protein
VDREDYRRFAVRRHEIGLIPARGWPYPSIRSQTAKTFCCALAPEAFDLLRPAMQPLELPIRFELIRPDVPSETAYFLESGLASVVATNSDDETAEVGHIGYEGMAGAHVLLKVDQTPNRTFMQAGGHGIRCRYPHFFQWRNGFRGPNDLLLKYMHYCALQLAHSALANARYNLTERLARWLLIVTTGCRTMICLLPTSSSHSCSACGAQGHQ